VRWPDSRIDAAELPWVRRWLSARSGRERTALNCNQKDPVAAAFSRSEIASKDVLTSALHHEVRKFD